jgi:hypothetical protein
MNPQDPRRDGRYLSLTTSSLLFSSTRPCLLTCFTGLIRCCDTWLTDHFLLATDSKPALPSAPALKNPDTGSIADRRATPGLLMPKNRSSGNLVSQASGSNSGNSFLIDTQSQRGRLSVDAGTDYDLARCVQTGVAGGM